MAKMMEIRNSLQKRWTGLRRVARKKVSNVAKITNQKANRVKGSVLFETKPGSNETINALSQYTTTR